ISKTAIAALAQRLQASQGLYFTGMGTAYYVALLAQYYFATLAGRHVPVLSADEFPILGQVGPGSLTLAVSQSGETYDTLKALRRMYTELTPHIQRLGHACSQIQNWLFIGRGIYSAVALESALKFKEVSYLHAEGMSGGFLKHGTIALIDAHMHSLAFLPTAEEPALLHATLTNIQEIRARGGRAIGIHQHQEPCWRAYFADEIIVPATPALVAPFVQP